MITLLSQALTIGSIAQLVQSICLTSRGSGVRIPLLPLRKTTNGRLLIFTNTHFSLCAQRVRVEVAPNLNKREHSSAGSEHLPYKQRVRGSNPFAPTKKTTDGCLFSFYTIRYAEQTTNAVCFCFMSVLVCSAPHKQMSLGSTVPMFKFSASSGVDVKWGRR